VKAAFVLGGLVFLPACPLLEVQGDAPEVCLTYSGIQVAPGTANKPTLNESFSFDDLKAIHDLQNLDASLAFVSARARATSGITDFSFVQGAHITVASGDPMSTLPPLTLYDCNGDCIPSGDTLEMPAAVQENAIDYVKSDSILIDLDLTGQLPAQAWNMDVDVCMHAKVDLKVQP
jgi:hypothetical protein